MTREPRAEDELQALWQGQTSDLPIADIGEIRHRATDFEYRIRRRNRREYMAAVFVAVAFGVTAARAPGPLTRAGAVLIVLATAYVVYRLRRESWRASPEDLTVTTTEHVAALRSALERQRDLLGSAWKWYVAPLTPGLALLLWGKMVERPDATAPQPVFIGSVAVVAGFVFSAVAWRNRRAARRLEQRIAALK